MIVFLIFSLLLSTPSLAEEDDVRCLEGLQSSLFDPSHTLPSWNFSNSTTGFVCSFTGVSCWNPFENRVLALSLTSLSLSGTLPPSLHFCRNANSLDLSSNLLSGPIPPQICTWLPYLVSLDLSNNLLSGPIPADLSSCQYLNSLLLSNNRLSGPIPASISALSRLHRLDLSNNLLSGQIPPLSDLEESSFSNNPALCGRPLSSCSRGLSRSSFIVILFAGILGAAASLLLGYAAWGCSHRRHPASAVESGRGHSWAERLRYSHNRLVPVSLFQKPIVKVKIADLLAATNDFHSGHIVVAGSARTGTSYKAVLSDGSTLTVKRLHACSLSEKQFASEMGRIGQLRHPNLVPLLGFCAVEEERFLVYKHMPNGSLLAALSSLDWPSRLRIGVGAARGLAWLHHGSQVPFLHRTVSSNAVLLDEDYESRITDFSLTRLVSPMSSAVNGANTSPFMNGDFGEFGYVPFEYATNPIASTKGDVYAFGVVLLELATGQKPTEIASDVVGEVFKGNLVDWVNQLSRAGRIQDAIDKSLSGRGCDDEIMKFLTIACGCVVARSKERPLMYQVYDSLKSIEEGHEFSEQFDEFPLNFGKDDSESLASYVR